MSFTPKTYTQILSDMITYVSAYTEVSDFSPGSVVRTILEAAALEDDEQYFQMVQLLDLFAIANSRGDNLDRRLAEYNITRLPAQPAFGYVRIANTELPTEQIAMDAVAGSTLVVMFNSTVFPVGNFPYVVRIAEGTTRVQDAEVIAINTLTNELTLSGTTPLVSDIFVGDRISLVTGSSSHIVNSGTAVQVPASATELARTYELQEPATIAPGNFLSNEVLVVSTAPGSGGNVSAGKVTSFVGNPPFTGAIVISQRPIEGGLETERDGSFRQRGVQRIQSLSRGTPLSLKSAAIGITDVATGQRVVSANLVENFDRDEVVVYIDDGSGFSPDIQALPAAALSAATTAGVTTVLSLNDGGSFPSAGHILLGTTELIAYVSKPTGNQLLLEAPIANTLPIGTIVRWVDFVADNAEPAQRRFQLQNFPIVRGTDLVFVKEPAAGAWTQLVRDTDFLVNRGTGEFLLIDDAGVPQGTEVVAFYNYYTNLIAETQKVLEGSPLEPLDYPGFKAAGTRLVVEAPVIKRISAVLSISAEPTFTEAELAPLVQSQVEEYILSLRIGEDVFASRIIDAAHNVEGVKNVTIVAPAGSTIVVLEDELPIPYDALGNSLITVL